MGIPTEDANHVMQIINDAAEKVKLWQETGSCGRSSDMGWFGV